MSYRHVNYTTGITLTFILIAIAPALAFGRTPPTWLPSPLKNYSFDLLLLAAPYEKKLTSILNGSLRDDRMFYDRDGTNIRFESEDGLSIAGTIYMPEDESIFPGIVVLHGSTPEGRKLGLYRMIGQGLSKRGFVTLTIDLRGFGESDDPSVLDDAAFFSSVGEIRAAFTYLTSLGTVDRDALFLISHSGSANEALGTAIEDDRIKKVVWIGPPRRVAERFGEYDRSELEYGQRRFMRDRRLPNPISQEVYKILIQGLNIEHHLDYLSKKDHVPILVIDGGLEDEQDHLYLEEIIERIAEPKDFYTLNNGDHYANTANFGSLVFYDENVINELINQIDLWFSAGPEIDRNEGGSLIFREISIV